MGWSSSRFMEAESACFAAQDTAEDEIAWNDSCFTWFRWSRSSCHNKTVSTGEGFVPCIATFSELNSDNCGLLNFCSSCNCYCSGFQPFSCSDPFCNPIQPNDPHPKISNQPYEMLLCLHNRKSQ